MSKHSLLNACNYKHPHEYPPTRVHACMTPTSTMYAFYVYMMAVKLEHVRAFFISSVRLQTDNFSICATFLSNVLRNNNFWDSLASIFFFYCGPLNKMCS